MKGRERQGRQGTTGNGRNDKENSASRRGGLSLVGAGHRNEPISEMESVTRPSLVAARIIGLAVLVGVAAWLRWQYMTTISLYVDEFTTMWAAERVLALGVPIMPSGVLYTRGLLDTYITALFMGMGGTSYLIARLPSLLFGLATIPLIWWVGKKGWSEGVGWLAAVGLVLLPEAIVWQSRARFYAPLQTFSLLTVWTGFLSVQETKATWRTQLAFTLMFTVSLFLQEQTILLYPALALGVLLWRGRKAVQEPPVIVAHMLCVVAMVVRYLIEIYGQPGYFETIQAQRPYVGLFGDVLGTWNVYAPLFITPDRLVWTIGAVIAVVSALIGLRRVGLAGFIPNDAPSIRPTPTGNVTDKNFAFCILYFALAFLSVLFIILFFVGDTWRDSRYLFFVQPLWLLLGAAGWWEVIRRISIPRLQPIAMAGVAVLAVVLAYAPAQNTLTKQQEGYDVALAYIAQQRQAEDVVLTPQPPACALVLNGPCNFFAIQRGYEEYVIKRDGVWIDRWTGASLLNTTSELEEAIRTAPTVWLATDGLRLATRYEADFLETLIMQFEKVYEERGVAVLRAEGWRDAPAPVAAQMYEAPLEFGNLRLEGWQRSAAEKRQPLTVTLTWHGEGKIDAQYQTFVHLVDAAGTTVAQDDSSPAKGMIPTVLFDVKPLPDPKTLDIPADLPDGRYRLDVGVYDAATLAPQGNTLSIGWVTIGAPPVAPTTTRTDAWANGLQLVGHDALPDTIAPRTTYNMTLHWSNSQTIQGDLTAFVHLVTPDGTIVAQDDHAPEHGFYPTSAWQLNDRVVDTYTFTTPDTLPDGPYTLRVGWYTPDTFQRVLLTDGQDALPLATYP